VKDDVIGSVLVRASVLHRITRRKFSTSSFVASTFIARRDPSFDLQSKSSSTMTNDEPVVPVDA